MAQKKFKFWTKEEDDIIREHPNTPRLKLSECLKEVHPKFSDRSLGSIYQRISYVRFMPKDKIIYKKTGVPVGTKRGTYPKASIVVFGRVVPPELVASKFWCD